MKPHKIESFVYTISVIALIVFIISIIIHFAGGDRFWITDIVSRLFYAYAGVSPIVIYLINKRRKKRGHNDPLSIEAMRTAKKELPNKIYKFCSLSLKKGDDLDKKKLYSLENKKIWMSDCSVLNDPYEGMYAFVDERIEKEKNEFFELLINKIKNQRDMYIQSSFSYKYDNILMWGHYANGCRGYCVEYEISSKQHLFPVQYVNKRPLLASITDSDEVKNNLNKIKISFDKIKDDEEHIAYMLYVQAIKDLSWSYEKEVRLIEMGCAENGEKCGNVDCEDYGLKISKIIIGCHCVYKKELIDIAKKLQVPVSIMEMPLNSNKYQLIEKEIN
ncbi:MAG: DUF2971 domain-containing protein [Clostridia bacterium]|nr:DUF2971 domain-containing protein [Clostridia bacterium]